ncbi:MAG: Mth938-like domain-containing protein [Gammaproteobacteria bacterium]
MTLSLDENSANYQIRAYKPGMIKVNDQTLTHSIIISSDKLIENWPPQHISELKSVHMNPISDLKPTILLIGTGEKLQFPPLEVYGDLINQGVGVEIMDTSAACRTYIALSAEGRNVVAALIIK